MAVSRSATLVVGLTVSVWGANSAIAQTGSSHWAEPVIVDNSFLIEEAYNQEFGVVQHISTLMRSASAPRDYMYSLTEEWPFSNERHQLSYTVPVSFLESASATRLGDVTFNYRYQIPGLGQRLLIAPRASILAASGNPDKALGGGAWGGQVNLPVSYRLTEDIASHLNVGATLMPRLPGTLDDGSVVQRSVTSYTFGGSLIGPITKPVNAVLEYAATSAGSIRGDGTVAREMVHLINPGVRFAVNVGPVQFVPGFSVVIDAAQPAAGKSLFGYLSIEHAFRTITR